MQISEQISEKVESLKNSLLASHPQMPTLLQDIWRTLKANPDCTTLLSEEEIGVIVNGLKLQTSTEIATAALKTKKSIKSIQLTDL